MDNYYGTLNYNEGVQEAKEQRNSKKHLTRYTQRKHINYQIKSTHI